MIDRLNTALDGRYRIERELGEGGMATVYLAEDVKHRRRVAIKVLKPELAAVVGGERFLAEIETTANLQHPHILPLFDSGEADGFLYYVMPYVEGESLRARLDREKQLPVDEAVGIAVAVGHALEAAHEEGVIHRDIKPANILLSRGQPLVADFGIALAVQQAGGGRLTETGLSLGTPYYMSPEQATGDREVAPASDVYALGCVLYEMLVGEPPYVGNTAQAVLGKILTDTPNPPTSVRATIPLNVEGAVLRALEKLPADRFPSADDFVSALRDPEFRHSRSGSTGRDRRAEGGIWKPVALGALALVLVLAGVLAWKGGSDAAGSPLHFHVVTPGDLGIYSGAGVGLDVSPDGSSLVFIGLSDGQTRLWLRRTDQLEPRPLAGTLNARNPRFSPDGRSVAFTGEGRLMTASLAGGPPLTLLADSVLSGGGGLAWGDDGYLYVTRSDGRIWRVFEGGGAAEAVTPPGDEASQWLDALPEGRGLLLTRDLGVPAEDRIEVLSLETGETTPLFPGTTARYAPTGHIVYTDSDGALLAVPFDPDRLEVTGPRRTLLENVQVNSGSASQFALSPSGVLVYRQGAAAQGGIPTWIGQDGAEEPISGLPPGHYEWPSVSPDGARIAFAHQPIGGGLDIWIYDLRDEVFTRFTFAGDNTEPFWSPDGSEVGFLSDRWEGPGNRAIYARPADMSREARLLRAPAAGEQIWGATWSPDGRIVYASGISEIHHAPAHPDSAESVLLDNGGYIAELSLSPDGRWIAYISDESGRPQVYVRPFPGVGGQRQISAEPARGPRWSADGDRLVYQREEEDVWIAARIETSLEFRLMERVPYADGRGAYFGDPEDWGLAPDGRLIAMRAMDDRSAGGRALVVIVNWFEELEARTESEL